MYHVNDSEGAVADDLDDQGAFTATTVPADMNTLNNYGYDETGNLIRDDSEEIASIEWTQSGKIRKINRITTSSKPDLEFQYDAMGNKVAKIVKPPCPPKHFSKIIYLWIN